MAAPTIVIGTDFSEGSRRAVQAISFLARGAPARLRLVHSFPPGKPKLSGAELRRVKSAIARAETKEAAKLSTLAERLRRHGFLVETVAVEGKAAQTLLSQARRVKAGLIAVGTSGRRGVGAVFLGSVAQAVLRDSPVPVMVLPGRNRKGSRRAGPVLAAIDFDGTAPAVLAAAAGLASDLGVKVHAFHALRIPFIGPGFPDAGAAFTPDLLAEDEEAAAVELTKLVEPFRRHVDVATSCGIGDAPTHLLALAQHLGASAIVVGRRKTGRRLGSASSALVQAADRPVVVIPAGFKPAKGGGSMQTLGFGPSGP
ncbi:MAG: universal stress protein [Candidatus Thermoplasmatota archaeon]